MSSQGFGFPQSRRLRKSAEYRKIYQEGSKFAGSLFAAFYRRAPAGRPTKIGYTTTKAMGKAVVRNRIRRRLREAVRLELGAVEPGWEIVVNPRRATLEADFGQLRGEIGRLFERLRERG